MADIRINALTLCNFKGLRNETFNFNGKNGVLVGDNGTGKSTVFDAFIWLLSAKIVAIKTKLNLTSKPLTQKLVNLCTEPNIRSRRC